MDEATATAQLELMLTGGPDLAPSAVPALRDRYSWTEDKDGDGVEETYYDLNASASDGWLMKAGIASSRVSVDADGARVSGHQEYQHCTSQAQYYRSLVPLQSGRIRRTDVKH